MFRSMFILSIFFGSIKGQFQSLQELCILIQSQKDADCYLHYMLASWLNALSSEKALMWDQGVTKALANDLEFKVRQVQQSGVSNTMILLNSNGKKVMTPVDDQPSGSDKGQTRTVIAKAIFTSHPKYSQAYQHNQKKFRDTVSNRITKSKYKKLKARFSEIGAGVMWLNGTASKSLLAAPVPAPAPAPPTPPSVHLCSLNSSDVKIKDGFIPLSSRNLERSPFDLLLRDALGHLDDDNNMMLDDIGTLNSPPRVAGKKW
ncbi:hypothetical protein P692DRAFT_201802867 [Suillus brevipes Sb2]|nr:hypothetical protein P692DRAFT_201802867 [Suillus brevipes Sb2]